MINVNIKTPFKNLTDKEKFCLMTVIKAQIKVRSYKWTKDFSNWNLFLETSESLIKSEIMDIVKSSYEFTNVLVIYPFNRVDSNILSILMYTSLPSNEMYIEEKLNLGVCIKSPQNHNYEDFYIDCVKKIEEHINDNQRMGFIVTTEEFAKRWNLQRKFVMSNDQNIDVYTTRWFHNSIKNMSVFLHDRSANHKYPIKVGSDVLKLYNILSNIDKNNLCTFSNGILWTDLSGYEQFMSIQKSLKNNIFNSNYGNQIQVFTLFENKEEIMNKILDKIKCQVFIVPESQEAYTVLYQRSQQTALEEILSDLQPYEYPEALLSTHTFNK